MNKLSMLTRIKLTMAAILLVIATGGGLWLYLQLKESRIEVAEDRRIDITPQQIQSIKAIGQWEFLSIANEEMVDTVRKGFFSNDELVRIYYGTMRLGIDLHQAKPGWIRMQGDTLCITLPPVTLLDHDFIDETRTQSFYESGKWSGADRDALYRYAYRRIRRLFRDRCGRQSCCPRYAHGKSNHSRQQPQGKAPHAAGKKFFR